MPHNSSYIVCLILGSLLVAAYRVLAYVEQIGELTPLARLWPILFPAILVLWASEDSMRHPGIYRPFDWEFLAFIFWIPYMPYYLWRSRGIKGIALALGVLALALLGDIAVLVASVMRDR